MEEDIDPLHLQENDEESEFERAAFETIAKKTIFKDMLKKVN